MRRLLILVRFSFLTFIAENSGTIVGFYDLERYGSKIFTMVPMKLLRNGKHLQKLISCRYIVIE